MIRFFSYRCETQARVSGFTSVSRCNESIAGFSLIKPTGNACEAFRKARASLGYGTVNHSQTGFTEQPAYYICVRPRNRAGAYARPPPGNAVSTPSIFFTSSER